MSSAAVVIGALRVNTFREGIHSLQIVTKIPVNKLSLVVDILRAKGRNTTE